MQSERVVGFALWVVAFLQTEVSCGQSVNQATQQPINQNVSIPTDQKVSIPINQKFSIPITERLGWRHVASLATRSTMHRAGDGIANHPPASQNLQNSRQYS